ncbi:hypothetical protein [Thermovibrio sp.]
MRKALSYIFSFTFFILVLKILYLIAEFIYNSTVLDILSSPSVDKNVVENLENFAHIISALGTTLLIIGFVYQKFLFNFRMPLRVAGGFIAFTLLFSSFYKFYDELFAYIFESLKKNEQVYVGSFYVNLLRTGIINGNFEYPSIIPVKASDTFSLEDRVMLANTYLVLLYDSKIVEKFHSSEVVASLATLFSESLGIDLDAKWNSYKRTMKQIEEFWKLYKEKVQELNVKLKRELLRKEDVYRELLKVLQTKYWKEYQERRVEFYRRLNRELSDENVDRIDKELKRFFRYKFLKKAQRRYRAEMYKNFHHYIPPREWCLYNGNRKQCPSKERIRKVLLREAKREFKEKFYISPDIYSFSDFIKAIENISYYREKIRAELFNKGLIVPHTVELRISSPEGFYRTYGPSVRYTLEAKFGSLMEKYLKRKGLPPFSIPPGLSRSEFLKKVKESLSKYYGNVPLFLSQKGFYRFYVKNLLPNSVEEIEENRAIEEFADLSLKLVVIPPIALMLSSVIGFLNLITLLLMPLNFLVKKLFKGKRLTIWIAGALIISILIIYPLKAQERPGKVYQVFLKLENRELSLKERVLVEGARWLLYVEPYAYKIGSFLREHLPSKLKREYKQVFKL